MKALVGDTFIRFAREQALTLALKDATLARTNGEASILESTSKRRTRPPHRDGSQPDSASRRFPIDARHATENLLFYPAPQFADPSNSAGFLDLCTAAVRILN